jgi:hypothetical protein
MPTSIRAAARRRRLLLAAGLAILLAAPGAITAVLLTRPPEPTSPLTAEGLFPVGGGQVGHRRFCGLLC